MRTVTYGAACSLDGYIAGPGGEMDWIHFSADAAQTMATYWATVDALVMGRKTWAFAAAQQGSAGTGGTGAEDAGPAGWSALPTYVFSRTLRTAPAGVELVESDPGAFVGRLKQRAGKGICLLGGGELAQALFAAGAVDEVALNVHPILLGSGVPLFRDPGRRVPLELVDSRTIDGGCVLSRYRVRAAPR